MKTALKKSLVLIGIALFFVLTAWAGNSDWGWDNNVPSSEYCLNGGIFKPTGGNATTLYGYCICTPAYWGQRCEFENE